MTTRPSSPITKLLEAAGRGDAAAHDQLWSLVYDELHRIAHRQMTDEAPGGTLQTTVLVNEAYLRLMGDGHVEWANRRHFFAAAAKAMRRIRVDDARKRERLKRGGPGVATRGGSVGVPPADSTGCKPVPQGSVGVPPARSVPHPERGWGTPARAGPRGLKRAALPVEHAAVFDQDPAEVLAVDEALRKLEQADPRKAEVVNLRYFAGLTVDECAAAMELSPRTVEKDWRSARAWLHRELTK